jgi:hypothetical protein
MGDGGFSFRKPVDERTLIDAIDWAVDSGSEKSVD